MRSVLWKSALFVLLIGALTGVGTTPGCGGGGGYDCYCEWVWDPWCACYVEQCYYCKTTQEKYLVLPEPPESGFQVEVRGDTIVAVPEEAW